MKPFKKRAAVFYQVHSCEFFKLYKTPVDHVNYITTMYPYDEDLHKG